MGQYILCTGELAKHPFIIRELGLRIYSGEELSYYIYHNLALIDSSFLTNELVSFLDYELGLRECANKIRKLEETITVPSTLLNQVLLTILREVHYFSDAEMAEFNTNLEEFRKKTEMERLLLRGDALLERNKCTSAIRVYEQYLTQGEAMGLKQEEKEKAWQHLAGVYMRMYLYDKGLSCLKKAYEVRADQDILKQMYFLSIYQDVDLPADFFTIESPETLNDWYEEYHKLETSVSEEMKNSRVSVIMTRDSLKREKELKEYLENLKREYRENE